MAEKAGQAFRKADKDKSGKIEVKELRGALKLLGIDHTKKHVREALAKYDTAQVRADGVKVAADGKLDLAEFTSLVFECTFEPTEPVTVAPVGAGAHIAAIAARADDVFKKADKNKSGTLEGKELRTVLKMLGIDAGKKGVAKLLLLAAESCDAPHITVRTSASRPR